MGKADHPESPTTGPLRAPISKEELDRLLGDSPGSLQAASRLRAAKEHVEQVSPGAPSRLHSHSGGSRQSQSGAGGNSGNRASEDSEARQSESPYRRPADLAELDAEFGDLIKWLIRRAWLRDVDDVYMSILVRIFERDLLGNYQPRLGTFQRSLEAFVKWQILGHRKAQLRARREPLESVANSGHIDPAFAEVETRQLLDEIAEVSVMGRVVRACAKVLDETGSVTGTDLGRELGVSPQAGRRHLARLRVLGKENLVALLESGQWANDR